VPCIASKQSLIFILHSLLLICKPRPVWLPSNLNDVHASLHRAAP
jgi:hypothetical protein